MGNNGSKGINLAMFSPSELVRLGFIEVHKVQNCLCESEQRSR